MKIIKRIIMVLLCACLFTGPLAGCARGGNVDLTVIHYRTEDAEFYNWFEKEFEKKYDCNVYIDLVPTSDWSQLIESALFGDSVDVFGIYPGSVYRDEAYIPYMLDLSDMDFVDKLTDEYKDYATYTDGKQYGAPLNLVNNTVFYNKTIFNQLNLQEPTNYSEFIAVCDALKAKSADFGNSGNTFDGKELSAPIVFGARETWPITMTFNSIEASVVRAEQPWFWVDVIKNGTKNLNDPLLKEAFRKYKQITSYYQNASFGVSYSRIPSLFAQGNYAMLIDGSWSYSQILEANPSFEIGVFTLPANDSADYKNVTVSKPGSGFAIHKNTKNADLAKKFIEFHYEKDVYEKFLKDVKMGSVLKGVQNQSEDPIINELYNTAFTNVSPFSEYIMSCISYPHSICEQLAIGGKDENYAIATFKSDYERVKGQIPKLMDKWMAIYNRNYLPNV